MSRWWLLAILPPLLSFAISVRQLSVIPASEAQKTFRENRSATRGEARQWRPGMTCGDPLIDDRLGRLSGLVSAREQRSTAERELHGMVTETIEDCPVGIDVLAVDCEENACIVVVGEGNANWQNELPLCEPLYGKYHGGDFILVRHTIDCEDGTEYRLQGTTFDLDPESSAEEPPFDSLEGRIESKTLIARFEELAIQVGCPQD